jgi:hypothetical protein
MLGTSELSLLIPLVLLPLAHARGTVVFSDDFSYPDGPLVTVSDGRWKTHSGTPGQVEAAGGQVLLSQARTEDVSATFPGGVIGPIEALTLYASFTVNFSALPTGPNGAYFAHLKDTTATTGIRCRIFASTNGAAPGMFRLGIAAATNAATSMLTEDLALQNPYRVVCRMLLGNNASTLWLHPSAETDESATASDLVSPKPAAAFAFRQSLVGSAGMGELAIDDLVVATTFAEVCPASPPPLALTISRTGADRVELRWAAEPGQSYCMWAADFPEGEFSVLAPGLLFADEFGFLEQSVQESQSRFYRVSLP